MFLYRLQEARQLLRFIDASLRGTAIVLACKHSLQKLFLEAAINRPPHDIHYFVRTGHMQLLNFGYEHRNYCAEKYLQTP